jgi:6-pyruvoyltetrahydropterin/6-carboxytetrahydropterin synthase
MITVTKIFRFEMGHAIDGYDGICKYIHGHSYVLHVTVTTREAGDQPLPPPGFVIDFKELKKIVNERVISKLDHSLILSERYVEKYPNIKQEPNLKIWPYEPSAENILYFIKTELQGSFSENYEIVRLRIWETSDSFAEWENDRPSSLFKKP